MPWNLCKHFEGEVREAEEIEEEAGAEQAANHRMDGNLFHRKGGEIGTAWLKQSDMEIELQSTIQSMKRNLRYLKARIGTLRETC
jgi:hypothetical protein